MLGFERLETRRVEPSLEKTETTPQLAPLPGWENSADLIRAQHGNHDRGRRTTSKKTSVWTTLAAFTVGVCLSLSAANATAEEPRGARIVNGLATHDYPTVAALMYAGFRDIDEDNANSWCTGTLVGCNTVLTAAHCVEDDLNGDHYWVYLQHSGIHGVDSIIMHPDYTTGGFPEFDLALVRLSTTVTGIDPSPMNSIESPSLGSAGEIVGFGQTWGSGNDYGIKRRGAVETSSCEGVAGPTLGNTELVCWSHLNPVGPAGDDSNTCNGDSGGPLFVNIGGTIVVAGVTSGGNNTNCLAADFSFDANVYTYRSFLLSQTISDPATACGPIPTVGTPDVNVMGHSGRLSASNTSDAFNVNLSGTPNEVRFALNGEDNTSFNVDFYVKAGSGASPSNYDCKSDGSRNVGHCNFELPTGGAWSVHVQRRSGIGDYQVTTTIFGGDPPVCGNDIREVGEDCDGTDANACNGLCRPDCSCPEPICGNNVSEIGEDCDGSDPGSCPTGVCAAGCECPAPICGNDITEEGEQCDGSDDTSCPGLCDLACACPLACGTGDLVLKSAKVSDARFKFKFHLNNSHGAYTGMDPRSLFGIAVTQGSDVALGSVPSGDPGWERSRPDRGKYRWKGSSDGLSRIKVIDKSARRDRWIMAIKGREVPGADGIEFLDPTTIDVEVTVGDHCVGLSF